MSDYIKDPFERCYDGAVMDAVWAANKLIGEKLGFKPREAYSVGTATASCISGDQYDHWPPAQKSFCERWIAEHKEYCEREGYSLQRREYWPMFHRDWNPLMEALHNVKEVYGVTPFVEHIYRTDIRVVWTALAHWAGANMKLVDKWKAEERTTETNNPK